MELHKPLVEPSPELLRDDYELNDSKKGSIHVFCAHKELHNGNIPNSLKQCFKVCNLEVLEDNIHNVSTIEDVRDVLVDNIYNEVSNKTHNFLMLFFVGLVKKTGSEFILQDDNDCTKRKVMPIMEIYNFLYGNQDLKELLRGLPIILIFHGFTKLEKSRCNVEFDGGKLPIIVYNMPPEADMLIAFKRYSEMSEYNAYIEEFFENVKKYHRSKDIVSLLMDVKHSPLMVSTLTKKFFLSKSAHRGVEFDIETNNSSLRKKIDEIGNKLRKLALNPGNLRQSLPKTHSKRASDTLPRGREAGSSSRRSSVVSDAAEKGKSVRPPWRN